MKTKLRKPETSIISCLDELTEIFKENYCRDERFQTELSELLIRDTGNDNLGSLCRKIINL